MAKEIYSELCDYYDISRSDDKKNRRIRKVVKERLEKAYPSKTWEELTHLEKQSFKLVTMRDYLIKDSRHPEKVEKKIQEELESTLFKANKALVEHNEYIEALFTQYYDPQASEEEKHNAYEEFCEKLHKYFPSEIPQSFEEWKKRPLRLWDVYNDGLWVPEPDSQDQDSYKPAPVTQEEIDHKTLECILLILEKEFYYRIDTANIKHCLEVTRDSEFLNSSALQAEIDPSSDVPEEEQRRRISMNLELMDSLRKLSENDFIKDISGK